MREQGFYAKVLDGRGDGFVKALPGRFENGYYVCRLVNVGKVDGKHLYAVMDGDNIFAYAQAEGGSYVVS